MEYSYGSPAAAQDQPRQSYTATRGERISALLSYILGFSYIIWTGIFWQGHALQSAGLALSLVLIVLMTELEGRDIPRSRESIVWLCCLSAVTVSWINPRDTVWEDYQSALFVHAFAVWWVISRLGRLLEGESSHLLPADAFNGLVVFPFGNMWRRLATLFSAAKDRKAERRSSRDLSGALWAAAGIAAVLFLFFKAASLLLMADSGFLSHFNDLFRFFSDLASDIGDFVESLNLWSFVLSIPVGAWLFGLVTGAFRTTEERLAGQRGGILSLLARIRKVPHWVWTAAACLFSVLYLAFFVLQSSYLFGAFTGRLPEGFIVSQYAREGFFELCRVIAVNFALLWLITRMSRGDGALPKPLLICCLAILAESMLFAVIAMSKIGLYISIFGFTPKRLQSSWLVLVILSGCGCWTYSLLTGRRSFRMWMTASAVTLAALSLI